MMLPAIRLAARRHDASSQAALPASVRAAHRGVGAGFDGQAALSLHALQHVTVSASELSRYASGLWPASSTSQESTRDARAELYRDLFVGRLSEVSGGAASAALSLAVQLTLAAQRQGDPVAWVGDGTSSFYPPDVQAAGVDLEALIVVRVPERRLAARAADHLVRSGGFGLVILDGVVAAPAESGAARRPDPMSVPIQSRLAALAKKHAAAIVILTRTTRERPSLGPLVSLRVEARRAPLRSARAGARFSPPAQAPLRSAQLSPPAKASLRPAQLSPPAQASLRSARFSPPAKQEGEEEEASRAGAELSPAKLQQKEKGAEEAPAQAVATGARGEASCYRCEVRVLKDKRPGGGREATVAAPSWSFLEVCRAPDGA